jgi:ABC-type Mn2+/Zn2+ transport system permease subunit
MRYALAGALLVSMPCAFLGVFLVLRRMVFVAVALSELAACGVALGLWLGAAPPVFAVACTVLGIAFLALPGREAGISRESLIGAAYALSAALALTLMALNPLARSHGMDLFAGDLLYTQLEHTIVLAVLATAVACGGALCFRRLLLVFFDRDMALTLGVPVRRIELGFLLAVALVVACSLRVAGVVFVFASLALPPLVGLAVGRRIVPALVIALIVAAGSSIAGLLASYHSADVPAGPAIVLAYGACAAAAGMVRATAAITCRAARRLRA